MKQIFMINTVLAKFALDGSLANVINFWWDEENATFPSAKIGADMAEWIRPQTSIPEVPGSNPSLAIAPLGKAFYPHCLRFWRTLKAVGPMYGEQNSMAGILKRLSNFKQYLTLDF